MAKLSEEKIVRILNLQRQLLEKIDEATETEFNLFEQFGETEQTMPELDELQNIRQRADTCYSRLYVIIKRIYESQPIASRANLELLEQTIEQAEVVSEVTTASIREIKSNWDLP